MGIHDINATFDREESIAGAAAIAAARRRIEHLSQLSALTSDPAFKDFRRELAAEVEHLKEVLTSTSTANVDFIRGEIAGLRRAILFFEIRHDEIDALEARIKDAEEKLDRPTTSDARYGVDDTMPAN